MSETEQGFGPAAGCDGARERDHVGPECRDRARAADDPPPVRRVVTVLEWTVTGYLLAYSALMIAAGRLADVFGRVQLITIGTLIYMGASIPAALSGNADGADRRHDPHRRRRGCADAGVARDRHQQRSAATSAGWRSGSGAEPARCSRASRRRSAGCSPRRLSWRWILWFNVIVGALILLGDPPGGRSYDEKASRHIDVHRRRAVVHRARERSCSRSTRRLRRGPFASAKFVLVIVASIVLLHRLRVPRAPAPRSVDRPRAVRCAATSPARTIVLFVLNFALGAVLFFVPQYLETRSRSERSRPGWLLLPLSATMMVAMPLGGRPVRAPRSRPADRRAGARMSGISMLLLSGVSTSSGYTALWPALRCSGWDRHCADAAQPGRAQLHADAITARRRSSRCRRASARMFGVALTGRCSSSFRRMTSFSAAPTRASTSRVPRPRIRSAA